MGEKLGILIAGLGGAIGSTVISSLELMKQGLSPKRGMLCESTDESGVSIAKKLNAPKLDNIIVHGWDVVNDTLKSTLCKNKVLTESDINKLSPSVLNSKPILSPRASVEKENKGKFDFGWKIERIRTDIKDFKIQNDLDSVVVVNCLPTQPTPNWSFCYEKIDKFQESCSIADDCITSSMEYATAAILESAAFVNFTPNVAVVPCLLNLAIEQNVALAGRDGKTGQTLIKTTIAPALKLRDLLVKGWYSVNIIGNSDGKSLCNPDACETKKRSKSSCLDDILGYPVEDHQIHIHHYIPRGDDKEAWDTIDIEGFLGYKMQMKINFLCKDSILAAPLVFDLSRLMSVAIKREEYGFLPQFSLFFKNPEVPIGIKVTHDLFEQRSLFMKWVKNCTGDIH